ncbi:hypothetical protein Vafri_7697, partial [Volvox africanus]
AANRCSRGGGVSGALHCRRLTCPGGCLTSPLQPTFLSADTVSSGVQEGAPPLAAAAAADPRVVAGLAAVPPGCDTTATPTPGATNGRAGRASGCGEPTGGTNTGSCPVHGQIAPEYGQKQSSNASAVAPFNTQKPYLPTISVRADKQTVQKPGLLKTGLLAPLFLPSSTHSLLRPRPPPLLTSARLTQPQRLASGVLELGGRARKVLFKRRAVAADCVYRRRDEEHSRPKANVHHHAPR